MAASKLPNFPGLANAHAQAHKASTLLSTATHSLSNFLDEESCDAQAQRLRGAAILALTAASELMASAGWHEAACEAQRYGIVLDDPPSVPPPSR